MPKNTIGGKNYKKQKHKTDENLNKPLLIREEGQEYAYVTKLLGNSTVSAVFYDNKLKRKRELNCILRASLRKRKQWAKQGSVILISLREFEKSKADVIHVYNEDDTQKLKNKNLIDSKLFGKENDKDDEFDFADGDVDKEKEYNKKKTRRPTSIKPRDNITVQDYGLPESNEESNESNESNESKKSDESEKLKKIDENKSVELKNKIKTFIKEGNKNSKNTGDEEISEEEFKRIKKIATEGGQHGLYGCNIC